MDSARDAACRNSPQTRLQLVAMPQAGFTQALCTLQRKLQGYVDEAKHELGGKKPPLRCQE